MQSLPSSARTGGHRSAPVVFLLHLLRGGAALCGILLLIASPAGAIEGLPGSTWGNLTDSFHGYAPSTGWSEMGWIN